MGTISVPKNVDFPAAYRRGIDQAFRDVNAGGDAVGQALHRMLRDVLSEATREGPKNMRSVEITRIFRDEHLEAERLEKRMVRQLQERVDELAGYAAAIGLFAASARNQGFKVAVRDAERPSDNAQGKQATK